MQFPAATERFLVAARAAGLDPDVRVFPDGTRTAADAAAAVGCDVAAIVKSIVMMAGDEPVVVLIAGDRRVDPARLASHLGVDHVRRAELEEVRAATGYAAGGTPPLGHATDIRLLSDRSLRRSAVVWAAAGMPTTVFPVDPAALLAASGAVEVDVAE